MKLNIAFHYDYLCYIIIDVFEINSYILIKRNVIFILNGDNNLQNYENVLKMY